VYSGVVARVGRSAYGDLTRGDPNRRTASGSLSRRGDHSYSFFGLRRDDPLPGVRHCLLCDGGDDVQSGAKAVIRAGGHPGATRVGARRRSHAQRSRHHHRRRNGQARPRRRIGVSAATLVPAVLIPSRLRPAPALRLRLARERDPPEPDPFTVLLGRSSAARGDSWSEQYECCPDNSDDTGSQQSHGTPPRLVSPIADPLLSLPEDAMPTRARRAATGPFVPERAAAEHPCRRAVRACRRRGPRLRAATRTERGAHPQSGCLRGRTQ
jgi:hypothetical protein